MLGWGISLLVHALAVILLLTRPMAGLSLAAAIIVSDVVVNARVGMTYGIDTASFLAQVLFLVFVMSTLGVAWRGESEHARPVT
jgi:hypothetical protein